MSKITPLNNLFLMKWIMLFFCLMALPSLTNCSSPSTQTQRDSSVPISSYRLYQWIGQDEAKKLNLKDPNVNYMASQVKVERRPGVEPQIRNEVEENLQENGFRPVPPGEQPDFYVTYYIRERDQTWVSTWEGKTPAFNDTPLVVFPGLSRNQAYQYRDGTLVLVAYDPKTKLPAWNGSALSLMTPEGFDTKKAKADLHNLIQELRKST
jgi:hypothetical protein